MKILVANLGSTSFKYQVLDSDRSFEVTHRGAYERIGQATGTYRDHGEVIDVILKELPTPPDAIGFKAVHGGPISGAVKVDRKVIDTMQQFADVAPAHNPCYIAAMKSFHDKLPAVPQVACFETAFHATIPAARQTYAIPADWTEKLGIRRYGFHGASHKFIATRMAEIAPLAKKIINCHLGGSSSMCAIRDGQSVATTMGLTPQTGLPQNNRVGDFDVFALLKLLKCGYTTEEVLTKLGKQSGLLGMSGVSNDMRDIEKAAADGNKRAQTAIDVMVDNVRHYVGAYTVALEGLDALTFTAGIGENGVELREAICRGLAFMGVKIDAERNKVRGKETKISADDSRIQVWVVPANEELIVAKQTEEVLKASS